MKFKFTNLVPWIKRSLIKNIMRTFLFLFCSIAFALGPNNVTSQNAKIQIDKNKLVTVNEVFSIIENQTNFNFIYSSNLFDEIPKIELQKGTIRAHKLLDLCLSNTVFTYIFTEDEVIILKRKSEFVGTNFVALPQVSITGFVKDKEGNPMPGVNVLVGPRGSSTLRGVSTNFEGQYNINASKGDYIKFTYLGFVTQEFEIKDKIEINVILLEEVSNLEEVVITGYQKLSVHKSTGAAKAISGKTIGRKGNSNILQSLEGQIAGLGLSSDPTSEGSKKFDIRGVTSLNGDSRPLIVVDGFPLEGDISTINPHEIESVTVLKDAASSSIYGARSANGVIVITTKKGKTGKLNINYSSVLTTSGKPDLSYRLNRVSSSDLVDIQKEASGSNPHTYQWRLDNSSNPSSYAGVSNIVYETAAKLNEGSITQAEADAIYAKLKTRDNTNQFEDYFLRSRFEQQHNISVSGGGDKNTFRTSLNYTENKFSNVGSNSDRVILDLVDNFKVSNKIDVDIIANVVLDNSKTTPVSNSFIFGGVNSYENIIDSNGNYLPVRLASYNYGSNNAGLFGGKEPIEIQRLIDAGLLDESYYPLKELEAYTNDNKTTSVRLQAMLNAEILKNLTGHFSFQYESGSFKNRKMSSKESFEMVSLINNTTPLSYTGDANELHIPHGARLVETRGDRSSYTLRGQLDYSKSFDDHEISGIVGSEIRNVFRSVTVTDKFGYDDSTLLFRNINRKDLEGTINDVYHPNGYIAGGIPFRDDFIETKNRYFSLYGNFTYGYKNKYIVSGSARIDQSNLFGTDPKYRYKPFWSVGGKWRVSEENFFNSSSINNLDFRVTYGVNGNISNKYGPFNIANALYPYRSGRVQSIQISTPAVADLRWEKTATTNFGVDMGLFDQKINIGLDYYLKETKDLLANSKTNPTLGFSNLYRNDANISNKGIEVSLRTTNLQNNNFSWSTFITFRHNKNKVKEAFSDEIYAYYAAGLRNYEGAPANTFWHFNWNGLNEDGEATIKKANGDIQVLDDFSPTSAFDMEDLVDGGTTDPIYSGAITNTFNYKNFGLSFMFIGNGGHVLLNDSYNGEYIGRSPGNVNRDAANSWKVLGDENITDVPRINSGNAYAPSITRRSTKNIIDGDYLKLREVILTYSLPQNLLSAINIDNVMFNLRANNLFYIAKNKKGIDPEGHGIGRRYYPTTQAYSFGVRINF